MTHSSTSPLCHLCACLSGLLMCYAHWKTNRHLSPSVFDLFFRQHPFYGEFTIFAGLEEVLRFLSNFAFTDGDITVLRRKFPGWDSKFFEFLRKIDVSDVRVYAVREGSVVFPRLPLIRVEGPLAICQMLESTLLTLVNYASLVATNAARHRIAVGPTKTLLEFGLRRAQGPDGAMSASRYAYLGGFDGTSNVKAASVFGMEMRGTHAHSFVVSFYSLSDLKDKTLKDSSGVTRDFVSVVLAFRAELKRTHTHEGELTAFISYAQAFPSGFLGLLDTFDTLESGIWNFVCVALALDAFGYKALGVRLDSGDLAYLSRECRKVFRQVGEQYQRDYFAKLTIVASNDLSEKVLYALKEQGHEIDTCKHRRLQRGDTSGERTQQKCAVRYRMLTADRVSLCALRSFSLCVSQVGVGTNLVTCKTQPALGCVYKLVEVNKQPRMKVSSDHDKVTIPGEKECYRLYNSSAEPVLDLLVQVGTTPPQAGKRILCRHPFDANKRVYVTPATVEPLHALVWDGAKHGKRGPNGEAPVNPLEGYPSLAAVRAHVASELGRFREDHLRRLNPTPYKMSVSSDLFSFMADLWLQETPIAEII